MSISKLVLRQASPDAIVSACAAGKARTLPSRHPSFRLRARLTAANPPEGLVTVNGVETKFCDLVNGFVSSLMVTTD